MSQLSLGGSDIPSGSIRSIQKSDSISVKYGRNQVEIKEPQIPKEELQMISEEYGEKISNQSIWQITQFIKSLGKQDIQSDDHKLILDKLKPLIPMKIFSLLSIILETEDKSQIILQIMSFSNSERFLTWSIIQNIPKLYISTMEQFNELRFAPYKRYLAYCYFQNNFQNQISQITSDFNRIKIYTSNFRSLNEVKREINAMRLHENGEFNWVFYGNQVNLKILQEQIKEESQVRLRTIYPMMLTDRSISKTNNYLQEDLIYLSTQYLNLDQIIISMYNVLDKIEIYLAPNGEHVIIRILKEFSSRDVNAYTKTNVPGKFLSKKEDLQQLQLGFNRLYPWKQNIQIQKIFKYEESIPETKNLTLKTYYVIPDLIKYFFPERDRKNIQSPWNQLKRKWKEHMAKIIDLDKEQLINQEEIKTELPKLNCLELEEKIMEIQAFIGAVEIQFQTPINPPANLNKNLSFILDKLYFQQPDMRNQMIDELRRRIIDIFNPNISLSLEKEIIHLTNIEQWKEFPLYQKIIENDSPQIQKYEEIIQINKQILIRFHEEQSYNPNLLQQIKTFTGICNMESLIFINSFDEMQYSEWMEYEPTLKKDKTNMNIKKEKFQRNERIQNEIMDFIDIQENKYKNRRNPLTYKRRRDYNINVQEQNFEEHKENDQGQMEQKLTKQVKKE